MTGAGSPGPGEVHPPNALVDEKRWAQLQALALRLPAGHPGRLIATEARPTIAEYIARLPLYERLLRGAK